MTLSIAHLGPPGTYAEQAAIFYVNWLTKSTGIEATLCPYPSIAQSLQAVALGSQPSWLLCQWKILLKGV